MLGRLGIERQIIKHAKDAYTLRGTVPENYTPPRVEVDILSSTQVPDKPVLIVEYRQIKDGRPVTVVSALGVHRGEFATTEDTLLMDYGNRPWGIDSVELTEASPQEALPRRGYDPSGKVVEITTSRTKSDVSMSSGIGSRYTLRVPLNHLSGEYRRK